MEVITRESKLIDLTNEHLDKVRDLLDNCRPLYKTADNGLTADNCAQWLAHYFDPESPHKLFGYVNGTQLTAMAGVYFWTNFPVWTLTNLRTRNSEQSLLTSGGVDCYRHHVYLGLSKGYGRFYFMSQFRPRIENGAKHPFSRWIPELNYFLLVTEQKVPANTEPSYKYVWDMMGHKTYPIDLSIRCATLSQEGRQLLPTLLEGLKSKSYINGRQQSGAARENNYKSNCRQQNPNRKQQPFSFDNDFLQQER